MKKFTLLWDDKAIGFPDKEIEVQARLSIALFRVGGSSEMITGQELMVNCFRSLIATGHLSPDEFVFKMNDTEHFVNEVGRFKGRFPNIDGVNMDFLMNICSAKADDKKKKLAHVCGLSGFGASEDRCPACEDRRKTSE